jgi:hypothetical protein
MFKPTAATTPEEYISLIDEPRRSEIEKLHKLIQKTIPDLKPHIVSGMIGYGTYHYRYASGREGDWSLVLLASQKNYISVYVCAVDNEKYITESFKDKLPKASIGKSCIRFKSLADIDLNIITKIISEAAKLGGVGQVS